MAHTACWQIVRGVLGAGLQFRCKTSNKNNPGNNIRSNFLRIKQMVRPMKEESKKSRENRITKKCVYILDASSTGNVVNGSVCLSVMCVREKSAMLNVIVIE